jgi:hypothetical protein
VLNRLDEAALTALIARAEHALVTACRSMPTPGRGSPSLPTAMAATS